MGKLNRQGKALNSSIIIETRRVELNDRIIKIIFNRNSNIFSVYLKFKVTKYWNQR